MENKKLHDTDLTEVTGGTDTGITAKYTVNDLVPIVLNVYVPETDTVHIVILQYRITSAAYKTIHNEIGYDAIVVQQLNTPEGVANFVGTTAIITERSILAACDRLAENSIQF